MALFHNDISDIDLMRAIKAKQVAYGGNRKLKIYGRLDCGSGKRMKRQNRIFFNSEEEALLYGYRPCGHCMKKAFLKWKNKV